METYESYRGHGITYQSLNGNTYIDRNGKTLAVFKGVGEIKGKSNAKKFIDKRIENLSQHLL